MRHERKRDDDHALRAELSLAGITQSELVAATFRRSDIVDAHWANRTSAAGSIVRFFAEQQGLNKRSRDGIRLLATDVLAYRQAQAEAVDVAVGAGVRPGPVEGTVPMGDEIRAALELLIDAAAPLDVSVTFTRRAPRAESLPS